MEVEPFDPYHVLTDEHMAWYNGGRREVFALQNQTDTVYNTLKKAYKICGTALEVDPH